jgi:hypothetical protein
MLHYFNSKQYYILIKKFNSRSVYAKFCHYPHSTDTIVITKHGYYDSVSQDDYGLHELYTRDYHCRI